MVVNKRFYLPPPEQPGTFTDIFLQAAYSGAGQLIASDDIPVDPWTPETLTDAIIALEGLDSNLDIRTVHNWFQDNDKSPSPRNIELIARIFGCGDPDCVRAWRLCLNKSRRNKSQSQQKTDSRELKSVATSTSKVVARNIASRTEMLFRNQSSTTLPIMVFAGACSLALTSFALNIHHFVYEVRPNITKQIGFLWAPNWTIVFLAILPLFISALSDLLQKWVQFETKYRPAGNVRWSEKIHSNGGAFWSVFLATVVIASILNWCTAYLIPLIYNDLDRWALDWGRVSIDDPARISNTASIFFTLLVFIYNGITAYLFFSGLYLAHLIIEEFRLLCGERLFEVSFVKTCSANIVFALYRCVSLGLLITICMKLQSSFLTSSEEDILSWLYADLSKIFRGQIGFDKDLNLGSVPGFTVSLLCLITIAGMYFRASFSVRAILGINLFEDVLSSNFSWLECDGSIFLLVVTYFAIGYVDGFSFLVLFTTFHVCYVQLKRRSPLLDGTR